MLTYVKGIEVANFSASTLTNKADILLCETGFEHIARKGWEAEGKRE